MYNKDKWVADVSTPKDRKAVFDWIKLTQGEEYESLKEYSLHHDFFCWPNNLTGDGYRKGFHLTSTLSSKNEPYLVPPEELEMFLLGTSGSQIKISDIFN